MDGSLLLEIILDSSAIEDEISREGDSCQLSSFFFCTHGGWYSAFGIKTLDVLNLR